MTAPSSPRPIRARTRTRPAPNAEQPDLHSLFGLDKLDPPKRIPTNRKLTPEDVIFIRTSARRDGLSDRELAEAFGVAVGTIADARTGKTWRWITDPPPVVHSPYEPYDAAEAQRQWTEQCRREAEEAWHAADAACTAIIDAYRAAGRTEEEAREAVEAIHEASLVDDPFGPVRLWLPSWLRWLRSRA